MRQKTAKRLRKEIYGDMSQRGGKRYITEKGQHLCDILRTKYKKAKKLVSSKVMDVDTAIAFIKSASLVKKSAQ